MNNRLGQIVTKIERKKQPVVKLCYPKFAKLNFFKYFSMSCEFAWIFEYLHLNIWVKLLQLVLGGIETLADNLPC